MSRKAQAPKKKPTPVSGTKNTTQAKTPKTPILTEVPLSRMLWPYLVLALFGFGLYVNTVPNKYAFDDSIVVTENSYTKEGISAIPKILSTDFLMGMWGKQMKMYEGGRYRPLSLVSLAIEYQFFGENPHISHGINALLYALTALLLYIVLQKLMGHHPKQPGKDWAWYLSLPFVITMLFIAHPIHTEAVANIKGRDEVFTLMGALGALWYAVRYIETGKSLNLLWLALTLFLALMSKESAVTFVAVVPLTLWVFTKASRKQILWATGAALLASFIFLRIRSGVLGGLPDNEIPANLLTDSFVGMNTSERYATTIYTFGVYLKLLFFPHPLTYDYYPYYIPIKTFADTDVWLIFILHVALILIALFGLKRKSIFAYGVLFTWITFSVVSNLFFSIGVFMSERFMYLPSLGFVIALVCAAFWLTEKITQWPRASKIVVAGFGLMVIGFSAKTIDRNFDWKDNFTLFTTDVKTSRTSFKSTSGAGEALLHRARKTENATERNLYYDTAIEYFTTTVEIFPDYIYVLLYLGDAHLERNKDYDSALKYYTQVFKYRPDYTEAYQKVERIFNIFPLTVIDADYRIATWEKIRAQNPECDNRLEVNRALGQLYGPYKNDLPKAVQFLSKAAKMAPQDASLMSDLGVAYSMSGQLTNARVTLEAAVKLKPNDQLLWSNLAGVYQRLGLTDKAREAQQKAASIPPAQ